jgi:hypothetical protein
MFLAGKIGVGCPFALSRFIVVSGIDAPEPLAEQAADARHDGSEQPFGLRLCDLEAELEQVLHLKGCCARGRVAPFPRLGWPYPRAESVRTAKQRSAKHLGPWWMSIRLGQHAKRVRTSKQSSARCLGDIF